MKELIHVSDHVCVVRIHIFIRCSLTFNDPDVGWFALHLQVKSSAKSISGLKGSDVPHNSIQQGGERRQS